jgi:hypothetical protein
MKRLVSISLAVFVAICFLVATDRNAWAYIDPGSGLLVLQGMASALATCGYFFRRRIKTLFLKKELGKEAALPAVPEDKTSANAV